MPFLPPSPLPTVSPRRFSRSPTICTLPVSPLLHRRIAITTPPSHAARLLPLLPPARPLWLPTVTTEALPDAPGLADLHAALLALPSFRVLAFTSRVAMRTVFDALTDLCAADRARAADMLRHSGVRVAALGADAAAARDLLGVTADIVPLTPSPDGLVDFLAADPDLAGAAVLCPVPRVIGIPEPPVVPRFLQRLAQCGFQVTPVTAYETRAVERACVDFELAALVGGIADAVVFTSQGEAYALAEMMTAGEREAFVERAREGMIVAAHGPYTAQGVRESMGVENVLVPQRFDSFRGVVHVLETAFAEQEGEKGELLLPT